MLKIFLTGDNHFGKKYNRYPDVRERLIQSRYDSLERMVRKAESEGCELFAVTGDLFDNNVSVDKKTVQKTVEILAQFNGTVLVLPGNHDYYTGEEKVWRYFESALNAVDNNIVLLNEFRPYPFSCGGEQVMVYPAFCQSKHSRENNLGWIKEAEIARDGVINIGIAHGAIQGVTPDLKQEYFLMTEKELESIPMDVWLIGHTHIPYPGDLKEDEDTFGHKIFNAGTHEQTDLSNNSDGLGFIITVRKEGVAQDHRDITDLFQYLGSFLFLRSVVFFRKELYDADTAAVSGKFTHIFPESFPVGLLDRDCRRCQLTFQKIDILQIVITVFLPGAFQGAAFQPNQDQLSVSAPVLHTGVGSQRSGEGEGFAGMQKICRELSQNIPYPQL